MQLGLRIQHAGRACSARRFGVTKQARSQLTSMLA
jgi:hypothetical protein